MRPSGAARTGVTTSWRLLAAAGLVVPALGLVGCGNGPRDPRPNLVIVLTDDQRYDTLGCTGGAFVETPTIDSLAREGALFTRAYVTTSLCCPARASLFTSLYLHKTGIHNNENEVDFISAQRDLAEVLQEAGYETAFFGKWHVPNPEAMPQPGFDHWVSFEGQGRYEDELFTLGTQRRVIQGFNTDELFELALEWLRGSREKPYLLVLSLKNLHRPYHPPLRHRRAVRRALPLPASFNDPPESLSRYLQRARTTMRNSFFDDGTTYEENVRGYHQMVLSVDDNLGKLLGELKKQGSLDSTAVLFTSDGGFMFGEHGLYRKRTAYEPSIHVPLILRYPAEIPAGRRIDRLALNVDVAPTLLDLARVEVPEEWQGRSLTPLWRETQAVWREDFLYTDGWGEAVDGPLELAVCGERYKYVRFRRGEIEEALYDREEDPDERVNLALEPSQAARLEAMRGRMRTLIGELEAPASWMDVE